MRTFLIGWVVAFCCVALAAAGVGWVVGSAATPPTPTLRTTAGSSVEEVSTPFVEADALEVIARRLATAGGIEQARQELRSSAQVAYHSPQHWRVCVDTACWVAHGPGRYAEPENDAARQREARVPPTR